MERVGRTSDRIAGPDWDWNLMPPKCESDALPLWQLARYLYPILIAFKKSKFYKEGLRLKVITEIKV
jgi:hypothetical protein